jgi:hypothetical protein
MPTPDWLEIKDQKIDQGELAARVQAHLGEPQQAAARQALAEAQALAVDLRQTMLGQTETTRNLGHDFLLQEKDCDIVPRNYRIDWRLPILGPINALFRRFINQEIRRFLGPSLERQSFLNRQLTQAVADLVEENQRLRREIDRLRESSHDQTD